MNENLRVTGITIEVYCRCGGGMELSTDNVKRALRAVDGFWEQHDTPECGKCDRETAMESLAPEERPEVRNRPELRKVKEL